MVMNNYISLSEASKMLGKSKETLRRWDREGILSAIREPISNYRVYRKRDIQHFLLGLFDNEMEEEVSNYVEPDHE